jgi:hypothetical protein
MSFEPDILVMSPDGDEIILVAQVKVHENWLNQEEQQLKRYMFGMRCPLGMLVTPESLRLFRDTYTSYGQESIERIGEYSTRGLFDDALARYPRDDNAAIRGFLLEDAVQAWLERLAAGADLSELPPDLKNAMEDHVLPALVYGDVRAAGPRVRDNWQTHES